MAITDIQISEELETNAPSIKYSGNEGPKSPQEMEKIMMMSSVDDPFYRSGDEDEHSFRMFGKPYKELNADELEEFKEEMMRLMNKFSKGPILPSPEDPVNPFGPKPQGPVLPNRQMAAYGGIMGLDGRKQYGIGSWFQENIMDPIKNNKAVAATAAALAGYDLFGREDPDDSILRQGGNYVKNLLYGKTKDADTGEIVNTGILNKKRGGTQDEDDDTYTYGGKILETIGKNIVPAAGGIMAGLFTDGQGGGKDASTYGVPSDNTAMNIQNLTKTANLLDQKQGLAAGMNFLPTVASRKYTPEEMAITYANAANGGRIGFKTGLLVPEDKMTEKTNQMILQMHNQGADIDTISTITEKDAAYVNSIISAQNQKAEGGIMDLGGMEKDYRAEGGFVPIGREEKADDVPARLSVNEFVFTADAVRNAGGGDIDQGAKVMENMMKHLEAGGQVSEESQGMAGARDMFATSQRLGDVV